jgi:hypothetical protein
MRGRKRGEGTRLLVTKPTPISILANITSSSELIQNSFSTKRDVVKDIYRPRRQIAGMPRPAPGPEQTRTAVLILLVIIGGSVAVHSSDTATKPATKSRPAVALVPKLEHISTVSGSGGGQFHQFNLRIANWKAFPVGRLTDPNPPPNPCKMPYAKARVWVELFRADGGAKVACAPVTDNALDFISFRDYQGTRPDVFAIVTDLKTGKTWKSQPVHTNDK